MIPIRRIIGARKSFGVWQWRTTPENPEVVSKGQENIFPEGRRAHSPGAETGSAPEIAIEDAGQFKGPAPQSDLIGP